MTTETLKIFNLAARRAMAEHLRFLANALDDETCDSIPVDWDSIFQRIRSIRQSLSEEEN